LLLQSSLYFTNYLSHNLCIDPLAWWWTHEVQFLNVVFLAKQIFEIPKFQIEIERMFNLVGVLIILRCYHLQVENLDKIIRVTTKEWHVFKGLQRITLDFCLHYIIIVLMDYCMPIDKMMSY
jgi:hypothetical protein